MNSQSFLPAYLSEITSNLLNSYGDDNFDFTRYVKREKEVKKITPKTMINAFLRKKKFISLPLFSKLVVDAIEFVVPLLPYLDTVYAQLADDDSRNILRKVLSYRALGYQKVKLPLNVPQYWEGIKKVKNLANSRDKIPFNFVKSEFESELPLFDLHSIDFPLQLYSQPAVVYNEFVAGQYICTSGQTKIGVEQGDIAIDVGGCWGETALHFAYSAGADGKVFSYEFARENLEVFNRNLNLNPRFTEKIEVIEYAAWSSSHISLNFEENGPGTRVIADNSNKAIGAETLSIDDLVESKGIARVDFIKMDIEGSELQALQGAINTIKRHRPELAISIYHKLVDFVEIPEFINSLGLGYRLFIRHYTIYGEETVLYAKVI